MSGFLNLEMEVLSTIKEIFDPEIPVNIYDLGLIYEIDIKENNDAYILMTLTSPNCPVAESMPAEVRDKVRAIEGINEVELDLTFDPPWDRDMISEAGQLELGLL